MTGATVGKVGVFPQTEQTYYLNQRVGLFQRVVEYPIENLLFTFFQEELAQAQVRNLAGGAAQPNISGGQIESIKLLIPDRIVLESYFEFVSGMFEQRANLLRQIAYLTQARDLLLPRLMDGRLEI
jgi:type I restriction enzyme S subunit